jgi:hypothetical protein
MTITPVVATLLGAVIGAAATLMSARLTQRATRDRETEFKVWERHIDAIEAAVRHTRDWERRRVNALRSGELDQGPLPEEALRVEAKLTLFGSPELLEAHNASFEALKSWSLAVSTPVWFRGLSSRFVGRPWSVVAAAGCCLVASAPDGPVQQSGRGRGWRGEDRGEQVADLGDGQGDRVAVLGRGVAAGGPGGGRVGGDGGQEGEGEHGEGDVAVP